MQKLKSQARFTFAAQVPFSLGTKVNTSFSLSTQNQNLGNVPAHQCPRTSAQAPSVNTALDPDYLFLFCLVTFLHSNAQRPYMYMKYFISDSLTQVQTNLQSACVFSDSFSDLVFVNDNLGTNIHVQR